MSFWLVSLTILKNNKSICIGTGPLMMAVKGLWNFSQSKKKYALTFNCGKL